MVDITTLFLPYSISFYSVNDFDKKGIYIFYIEIGRKINLKIISTIDELMSEAEFLKNQIKKINFDKYLKIRHKFYNDETEYIHLGKNDIINLDIVIDNFDFEEYNAFTYKEFEFNPHKLNFSIMFSFHKKILLLLSKDNQFITFLLNDTLLSQIFPHNYSCTVFQQLKLLFYYCRKFGMEDELLNLIEKGILLS